MKYYLRWFIICSLLLMGMHCSSTTTPADNDDSDDDDDGDNTPIVTASNIVADHSAVATFDTGIPTQYVTDAKNNLHIYYGHTSHGSQPVSGLEMLQSPYNTGLDLTENESADLGHNGDTSWVTITEEAIANDSTINVVIWAWCGGVADNTESGINTYLTAMNQLETTYPNITFVYMTGRHWNEDGSASVDGEGAGTNTHIEEMNDLIRAYVDAHDKVLYDFADIEEYDPAGTQYSETSDYCSWCANWCTENASPVCESAVECAHAHPYNCYIKGKAFWYLLARIAGWDGEAL